MVPRKSAGESGYLLWKKIRGQIRIDGTYEDVKVSGKKKSEKLIPPGRSQETRHLKTYTRRFATEKI